jgi:hypothetical protein
MKQFDDFIRSAAEARRDAPPQINVAPAVLRSIRGARLAAAEPVSPLAVFAAVAVAAAVLAVGIAWPEWQDLSVSFPVLANPLSVIVQ